MGQCNRPETSDSSQNCKLTHAIGVIIFWVFPKDIFTLLPRWNSCDGLKSRFGDTSWIQPTHSANKSWIYAWFGVRITNFFSIKFLPFSLVLAEFFGGGFSPPPSFGPWLYPVQERPFEETLCGNSNNASDIIEHLLYWNFSYGCPAVPIWEHACTGVTTDPQKQILLQSAMSNTYQRYY